MSEHWTAEEYRKYLETGRGPEAAKLSASPTCCQKARRPLRAMDEFNEWAEKKCAEEPKRQKYGNQRTEVDGLKFDSKHEAEVFQELMLRVKAGELRCVWRQVGFDLPGGIRYFADFVTVANDYTIRVLDAKSEATRKNRVYINKKKQVKALWGIDIEEV